ncbi:DUF2971 domain-containing protein [Schlesneria sp. T3-172]|uniref:DUF2971 domain-containing protein n=1 Tax=Schlesneria sphaerica TaxID=3373610 RepID=UPI0037CC7F44
MSDEHDLEQECSDRDRPVPKRLFKYQPATLQAILNLAAGNIWFADPLTFNDPFDCAVDGVVEQVKQALKSMDAAQAIEIAIAIGSDAKVLTSIAQLPKEKIVEHAGKGLEPAIASRLENRRGVSCFTESLDNPLMWGHYAESHRGFCLAFDTSFEPFNNPNKCRPVKYRESMPVFDLQEISRGNFLHVTEAFLTKAKCWTYEAEWRLLHNEKCKVFGYARHVLTDVYLGARMPEDLAVVIGSILSRTDTRLHRMELDPQKFKIVPKNRYFTPIDHRKS